MFKSKGKIVYFNNWVIVECDKGIMNYYCYWVMKKTGYQLNRPKFGSHISLIRGEVIEPSLKIPLWKKYHENIIEFEYSPILETNLDHWWLPAKSNALSELRKEFGLEEQPLYGFHLTIGREFKEM